MDYLDFELEIGAGRGRDYPVTVIRSPGGEAREEMHFPFDQLALENRLKDLQIALLRSGGKHRRVPSTEEQAVQNFGRTLFNAITAGEVRSRYDVSLREARQQNKGLRLKLRVVSAELSALPWEFLYDERQGEYLCLSETTPVVRYLELPQPIQPVRIVPPLRLLGMIASPSDLPILDVDRERQRIERAVEGLRSKGKLDLTWVPGATWRDLQRMMRQGPWHIFHFIGHGGFDSKTEEGLIAFSDEQGKANLLNATQAARLLADHRALRLVVLNACEGAKGSERDVFSSTAAMFVRRGISAVIAMQHEITDQAAIEFSRSFYEVLADGLPIDAAVTAARIAINIEVNNSLEWGTPVLHMRAPDGVLFEPSREPGKPQPAEPIPTEPPRPQIKTRPPETEPLNSETPEQVGDEPAPLKHEPPETRPQEPEPIKLKPPIRKKRPKFLIGAGIVLALAIVAGSVMLFRMVPPKQAQRIALVTGNSVYREYPDFPIPNAVRDVSSLADALEKRGFKVMELVNLDHAALTRAVTEFESTLSIVGGVGLFYFAGISFYIDGDDIMLPVDGKVEHETRKIIKGINLTELSKEIQSRTTENKTSNGSVVIYSASKGQLASDGPPGGNSPFMKAFLGALADPNAELGEVFLRIRKEMEHKKQTPVIEDSRSVKFYFNRLDQDPKNGILKILVFDSCRDNPFKPSIVGGHRKGTEYGSNGS